MTAAHDLSTGGTAGQPQLAAIFPETEEVHVSSRRGDGTMSRRPDDLDGRG